MTNVLLVANSFVRIIVFTVAIRISFDSAPVYVSVGIGLVGAFGFVEQLALGIARDPMFKKYIPISNNVAKKTTLLWVVTLASLIQPYLILIVFLTSTAILLDEFTISDDLALKRIAILEIGLSITILLVQFLGFHEYLILTVFTPSIARVVFAASHPVQFQRTNLNGRPKRAGQYRLPEHALQLLLSTISISLPLIIFTLTSDEFRYEQDLVEFRWLFFIGTMLSGFVNIFNSRQFHGHKQYGFYSALLKLDSIPILVTTSALGLALLLLIQNETLLMAILAVLLIIHNMRSSLYIGTGQTKEAVFSQALILLLATTYIIR